MTGIPSVRGARRRLNVWHRVSFRFALVVVLAIALTSALTFYFALGDQREQVQAVRDNSLHVVRAVAAFQEDLNGETLAMLSALGANPAIVHGDRDLCRRILTSELLSHPAYANLGVADRRGDVVCSAVRLPGPVNIGDRSYFKHTLAERAFSMGGYQIGRITGKPVIDFGGPVLDGRGRVAEVIFAALDMNWFADLAAKLQLPPGATLDVFDGGGSVVVAHPGAALAGGSTVAYANLIPAVRRSGPVTALRAGPDGVRRIYGITRLSGVAANSDMYLGVGLPVAGTLENVRQEFRQNVGLIGASGLLLALLALGAAVLFIQRPLDSLNAAAKRLAGGDLRARRPAGRLGREFDPVLHSFDSIAATLQERTTALQDSEAQFRALVEQSLVGVAVMRADAFVYVNDAYAEIFGYRPDEMAGRLAPLDVVHPDDKARMAAVLRERIEDGTRGRMIFRGMRKDGTPVEVEAFGREITYRGAPAVLGMTVDLTARVRLQSALHASEESFRSLVERVPVGLYRTTVDGRVLQANPVTLEITGFPDVESLQRVNIIQVYENPADRERWLSLMRRDGVVDGFEFRMRRPDGSVIWVQNAARAVYDDRGRLSHFEGFLADVTRQKEAADAQARRADEREAFHTLSHNLRAARTSAEMYPIICDEIMALLGGRYAYLSRLDPERGVFVRVHTCGVPLRETGSTFAVGESPSGLVVQSGESHVSPDVALDIPEDAAEFVAHGVGPSAVIPMRTEDGVVGTLGIMRPRGEDAKPFTEAEVRILEGMAEIGGIAIRRAELAESLERRAEEAERRQRELEALNEIQLAIRGSLDLRVMLNVLLDKAMTELQADAIDVLLLDPDTHALRPVAWRGFRNGAMQKVRLRLGEGYAGRVALTAAPMNIDSAEMAGDPAWREPVRAEGFVSYHAVPLVATGSVRGVIEVFRRRAVPPAAEWHRFFGAVAGQAAIAIDNATLFDNLRQANVSLRLSYDQTLEGWSRALDMRDRETEGHSQRVTDLAVALAQAMRVADADLVNIRRGALLHDIGKMGVPDAILLKPGPLTEEEWTAMRRHPAYARQLLAPIAYLRPSLDIPYRHHERWDGTGYPDGLKGVQIPLAARIFAVVDVWDALRSDRPYRPAWSADAAVAHIRDQSGRHFDPAVVEAFLDLVRAREREASGADASVPETAGFA